MLQIPGPLCWDKKADTIINKYINDRLISLMDDVMSEEIFYLFPENYEESKQRDTFMKLYNLLKDDEVFAPEQVMEYVLAQLIGLYQEMGVDDQVPMPDLTYVIEKLVEDFKADGSKNPEKEALEYLEQLEDPAEYMDLIFWDMDFALLDEFKEEDLARSNSEIAKNANFEER